MRKLYKRIEAVMLASVLSLSAALSASAAGWQQSASGWRYQNEAGDFQSSGWKQINGLWYCFDGNGIMRTGWYQDGDGKTYLLSADGAMLENSWYQDSTTQKWYYLGSGGAMQTSGKTPDGYNLAADGSWDTVMPEAAGWRLENGVWRHYDGNGTMQTGWLQCFDGNRYFLAEDGAMLADRWYQDPVSQKWYYLGSSGAMQKSGQTPDGYTLNADGSWNTSVPKGSGSSGGGPGGGSSSGGSGGGGGSSSGGSGGGGGSSSGGSGGGNSSLSQKILVNQKVKAFKDAYIREGMSDFEKEMEIVRYMTANIEYDMENYIAEKNGTGSIPSESYTAYGALVLGVSVCSGYAKAFQTLAEACGLESRYVSGEAEGFWYEDWEGHAWNKVKLDGEWYNVDVTWEDSDGEHMPYDGYEEMRNEYINVTDIQLEKDHRWADKAPACTAEKYSAPVVEYYMHTGIIDVNAGNNRFTDNQKEAVLEYINQYSCFRQTLVRFPKGTGTWLDRGWIFKNKGGHWTVYEDNVYTDNDGTDYDTKRIEYTLGKTYYDAEADQYLKSVLEPDNVNLCSGNNMDEYVKSLIMEGTENFTLVFTGPNNQYTADDVMKFADRPETSALNAVKGIEYELIWTKDKIYEAAHYTLGYQTLDQTISPYLKKDQSNLFADGPSSLPYLKTMLNDRAEINFMVYSDGKHYDYSEQIRETAKQNGIKIKDVIYTAVKEMYIQGVNYGIDRYDIEWIPTIEESLSDNNFAKYLDEDRANLFDMSQKAEAEDYIRTRVEAQDPHIWQSETVGVVYFYMSGDTKEELEGQLEAMQKDLTGSVFYLDKVFRECDDGWIARGNARFNKTEKTAAADTMPAREEDAPIASGSNAMRE